MLQLKKIKDKQIRQGYFYYMVGYLVNYIIYQEFFGGNTNLTMDFFFFKHIYIIYIIHDLHRPFLSIIKYKYIETFFYLRLKRKTYCNEISIADGFEDLVNGAVWGQGAVEDVEMPLQTGRDVITASTGVNHGRDHLNVHDVGELSRLLQVVETPGLHHLSSDLIGHLQKLCFDQVISLVTFKKSY